jgi:AcrR family transcriptional regulator
MRPRRLQPQQRREHLLDTAAAMFAEQPYDDVTIQDIAARAGVPRALMHHYFSTVDAINTFGVSAGLFALSGVVSRRESPCFRSSARFLSLVRFPAAPQRKSWSRPKALTSCLFHQHLKGNTQLHARSGNRSRICR